MDFSPEQILVITKVIIELTNPWGKSNFVDIRIRRSNRFEDDAVALKMIGQMF